MTEYVWHAEYVDSLALRLRDGNGDGDVPDDGERLFYCQDANYNTGAVVGQASAAWGVLERYVYAAYGEPTYYNRSLHEIRGHNTSIDKIGSVLQSPGMARLARSVIPGLPHHVTQRGNRRQRTFFNEEDYAAYIENTKRVASPFCCANQQGCGGLGCVSAIVLFSLLVAIEQCDSNRTSMTPGEKAASDVFRSHGASPGEADEAARRLNQMLERDRSRGR